MCTSSLSSPTLSVVQPQVYPTPRPGKGLTGSLCEGTLKDNTSVVYHGIFSCTIGGSNQNTAHRRDGWWRRRGMVHGETGEGERQKGSMGGVRSVSL